MTKRIVVNVIPEETRMALTEDGRLLEVAVERTKSDYMVGNIYKGRVENVLPGMQAAFINIGNGKNAFLFAGDIFPHKSFQRLVEEDNLTVGAEIMIEIVKDAMGTKGPRATTHFSIPGRYVVVMPSVDYVGVSRRIESAEERARLRALAGKIRPKGMGVIVRTVAEGHSEEELARDFQYLSNLWSVLTAKAKRAKAPFLLYRDADLLVRIIRDHVKDDVDEVVIDNPEAHARMVELAKVISPDLVKKILLYKSKAEIFAHFAIEDEWNRLADRRVELKCGGYLIIDKTEALTVIDVNTGRFIGHSNLADTVFRTNMEAAAEISRQLRLRDIGGIIVADFIDMQKEGHKRAILAELETCLKEDNTKTNVLGLTELGLVEMTRKKARQTYEGTLYESCPCCAGRGIIQSPDTLVIAIRRQLRRIAAKRPGADLVVQMHPRIAAVFGDKKSVAALEEETGISLTVEEIESMQPEVYAIFEGDKALVRSNEPKKIRKQPPRRDSGSEDESLTCQEPLSEEELAPLLAEKFAMEIIVEPVSTLEQRLAAMAGSLWEPLMEPDDEEILQEVPEAEIMVDSGSPAELKKPKRRRRSKKIVLTGAAEILPEKSPSTAMIREADPVVMKEAAAEEAPQKKSRRRRKPKKIADESVEPVKSEQSAAPESETPGNSAALFLETPEVSSAATIPKPKRKRRRKKKTTTEGEPEEQIGPAELPDSEMDMEGTDKAPILAPAEEVAMEAPSENTESLIKKTKRRRRKKKKPAAGSEPALIEEGTPPVTEASTEAAERVADQTDAQDIPGIPEQAEVPAKKTKRRRRRKKPAGKDSDFKEEEIAVMEEEPPEPLPSPAKTVIPEEIAPAAVKKKRRRRRSNSKAKPLNGEGSSESNPDKLD